MIYHSEDHFAIDNGRFPRLQASSPTMPNSVSETSFFIYGLAAATPVAAGVQMV
jgi:hypothetical protein